MILFQLKDTLHDFITGLDIREDKLSLSHSSFPMKRVHVYMIMQGCDAKYAVQSDTWHMVINKEILCISDWCVIKT